MMLYWGYVYVYGWITRYILSFDWLISGRTKKEATRVNLTRKPFSVRTCEVYKLIYKHRNEMKPILNETRHLEFFNHINYKAIGLVLSKIWFLEVYPRFLPLDLPRVACAGHNLAYITSNWVQRILLESLHIGQHFVKISESNSILVAPSNSAKLPHVLTGQRQGRHKQTP